MKTNQNFLGGGVCKIKQPSVGGGDGFFLELHIFAKFSIMNLVMDHGPQSLFISKINKLCLK